MSAPQTLKLPQTYNPGYVPAPKPNFWLVATPLCVWARTCRKIPVLGKHTKRIKCGCWSKQDLLALASDDHSLSVSNSDGDTVKQWSVQGEPSDVQFSEMKGDERSSCGENTVNATAGAAGAFTLLEAIPSSRVKLALRLTFRSTAG